MRLPKVINATVLDISDCFAGAWAALRARDFADNILLVDKFKVTRNSYSTFSVGVQFCPMKGDDLDIWKKESVEASDYFSNREWVDIFLRYKIDKDGGL